MDWGQDAVVEERRGGGGRIGQLPDLAQSLWEKTDKQITPSRESIKADNARMYPTSVTLPA